MKRWVHHSVFLPVLPIILSVFLICVQHIQILKTVCNRTVKWQYLLMLQIGPFYAKGLGQNPWPKTYFN